MAAHSHQAYELDDDLVDHELENLLSDDEHDNLTDLEDDLDIDIEKPLPPTPALIAPKIKRGTAYLDGLRGLAALCVFTQHTLGGGPHEMGFGDPEGPNIFITLPFVRVFYNGGGSAVSIFFVLSGFVVTQTMVKLLSKAEQRDFLKSWASALIRRPLRLYLPCWTIGLIIAFALHLPNNIYPGQPWLPPEENMWKELQRWAHLSTYYFNPFHYHASDVFWYTYDMVVWTIPIELKGSWLCYGLVALYGLANRSFGIESPIHIWAIGSLMVFCGIMLQQGYWWQGCFTAGYAMSILDIHQLDEPVLGRTFTFEARKRKITIPVTTIVLHVLFIASWYLLSQPGSGSTSKYSFDTPGWHWLSTMVPKVYNEANFFRYWDSWGAIVFVYVVLRVKWLQWIFATRPLQYLGRVSFMLYLVHLPVAYCFSDRWWRIFGHIPAFAEPRWWDNKLWVPDWGLGTGFNLRWAVGWTTVLMVNLCVAHLFTKIIDEPCVKLGKWITGLLRLNPPKKPKAPPQGIALTETAPRPIEMQTVSNGILPR